MARHKAANPSGEDEKKRKIDKAGFQKLLGIFRFMLPYKGKLIAGMLFLVLSSSLLLAVPQILGMMIDVAGLDASALPNSAFNMDFMAPLQDWLGGSKLSSITILLIAILFIQAIFSFFRVYLFALVHEPAMADVRQTLYKKYINLPLAFYDQNRTGDLISRITADVSTLQDAFSVGIAELLRQFIILVVGTITLFIITPPLTTFMLLTIPVIVLSAMVFGRYIRKLSRKTQDSLAKTNVIVEETLQNVNMVKAFANELFELLRYRNAMEETVKTAIHRALYRGAFVAFIVFALFSGIALVMWYGTTLVVEGNLSIGELVSFVIYTMFIGGSITGLANLYGTLQQAIGSSERIMEILDTADEPQVSQPKTITQRIKGKVQFQDLNFSYPTREDVPVLKGLDLNIKPGEQVALVGHSGAGKSTIVQLLLRFYQPSSGRITVDGTDIQDFNLSQYRSQIGIVPQEVLLFGGSIRENIAYGNPDAGEAEVVEAAKKANALEFIQSFPEGLDTVVGERGIKLSGGQRQRIAIARAILKDPAILLLDEATSSLDAASEQLVQEALEVLMEGRTSIVIAHRLATIRKVDRIYVLDQGIIAEAGSHEELMTEEQGLYSNLVKLQFDVNHA